MRERALFHTRVRARVIAADGTILSESWTTNMLTEAGEAYIADRLSDRDEADGDIDGFAIGRGSGQTRSSTTLADEVARGATTVDQGSGADDNDIVHVITFAAGTPATDETITEGALFSRSTSGGTMINYFEFSPGHFKPTTASLEFTTIITVGGS